MGQFSVGQVVSSSFPFSDLTTWKYRPALIAAIGEFDDLVLCQITSKPYASSTAIQLLDTDFTKGGLPTNSYIRPDKLFTSDASIVSKVYGELESEKLKQVQAALINLFGGLSDHG